MNTQHLIIYDGICHFCSKSIHFIIKRDPKKLFQFTPMQSDLAMKLIEKYGINLTKGDTLILIKNNRYFMASEAILEIAKNLSGYWYFLNIFRIIPPSIRNWIYWLIARNRYRIFGRSKTCIMPSENFKDRFIGI